MKDPYNRETSGLRISVTPECNLNCFYCHNEGLPGSTSLMSPEEIGTIVRVGYGLGIRKIKITGGEPLIRGDIVDIVRNCAPWSEEVSLTTNGTLLAPLAPRLKEAGLKRVNVSLDTVDHERYKRITGADMVDLVVSGIKAARDAGLDPVKVNIVYLSDTTLEDLERTVSTVWEMGGMVQLIEMVGDDYPDLGQIEADIEAKALSVWERRMHRRRIYTLPGGDIELVRSMHNSSFCANCTRLRLTADGKLKPCLMHNEGLVDILTPLRNGADDDELTELFKQAIMNRRPFWRDK